MDETENQLLVDLLKRDPSEVLTWLDDVLSGRTVVSDDFNWLGMAEGAAGNSYEESGLAETVQSWARVATSIYDRLAQNAAPDEKESNSLSSLMLRANMILRFGSVAGDPLLDQDDLVRQIEAGLSMPFAKAAKKSENWRQLNLDEIRALRRIKNRLAAIEVLASAGRLEPDSTLAAWLSLRKNLP